LDGRLGQLAVELHLLESKTMKIKIIIALVATAGMLGLAGCKPKATTVSGQVFIVTKGADNVKLGAVEILLIEKSQVTGFLQKKQPAIDLEMASKRQELTNAEQEVATALGNADKAQAYFDWFMVNKPYKTNADRVNIKSQWDNLLKQYVRQTNYVEQLSHDVDKTDAFFAALKMREKMAEKLNSLNDELDAIKLAAVAAETSKLKGIKANLEQANSHAETEKTNLDNSPTVADYLADFSPVIIQKTLSDSDGKFSFTYPRDKTLTIFAHAQRMVLDKTETYYWLVDAPTNAETAQIFLSNNNLVIADPDSYFKLKPKEAPQKSTEQ
jgi:hypothetical protein